MLSTWECVKETGYFFPFRLLMGDFIIPSLIVKGAKACAMRNQMVTVMR